MSEKRFVSTSVIRSGLNVPTIVLALYGARGGMDSHELTVSQARSLRDQLDGAIAELSAVADAV